PVWNPNYAWIYPTVSVNGAGNLAGMMAFGGGSYNPGSNIWISDDIQNGFSPLSVFGASYGNAGPTENVWGDYLTVRRHKDFPNSWVAATYYLQNGGSDSDA